MTFLPKTKCFGERMVEITANLECDTVPVAVRNGGPWIQERKHATFDDLPGELKDHILVLVNDYRLVINLRCSPFAKRKVLSRFWRHWLWEKAVRSNDINRVRWLHENGILGYRRNDMDEAAHRGYLEMLNYLHSIGKHGSSKLMFKAYEGQHVPVIDYLESLGYVLNGTMIPMAAMKSGNLDIVKRLHEKYLLNGARCYDIDQVTNIKSIEILKYIAGHQLDLPRLLCACALGGARRDDIVVLKWVYEDMKFDYYYEANVRRHAKTAAEAGQLIALRYLEMRGAVCDFNFADVAAGNGHFVIVHYLVAKNVLPTKQAMEIASLNGHMDMVKYLGDVVGCHGTVEVGENIVKHGRLDMMIYVKEKAWFEGFSSYTMDLAAEYGHMDILKWLAEENEGMTCSSIAIREATRYGHRKVVEYLIGLGKPVADLVLVQAAQPWGAMWETFPILRLLVERAGVKCSREAVEAAAMAGHLGVVRYLTERGDLKPPEDRAVRAAAWGSNVEVMRYLHSLGATATPNAVADASGRSLAMFRYLREEMGAICIPDHLVRAASIGDMDMLRYMVEDCKIVPSSAAISMASDAEFSDAADWLAREAGYKDLKEWGRMHSNVPENETLREIQQ